MSHFILIGDFYVSPARNIHLAFKLLKNNKWTVLEVQIDGQICDGHLVVICALFHFSTSPACRIHYCDALNHIAWHLDVGDLLQDMVG